MSSKSDYLRKYDARGAEDQDKKKRKKRPTSISKIAVKDDEDDANRFHAKVVSLDNNSLWDIGAEEDPVVVETTEEHRVSSGVWTEVNEKSSGNSAERGVSRDDGGPPRRAMQNSKDDSSPPRKRGGGGSGSGSGRHDSDDDDSAPLLRRASSNKEADVRGRLSPKRDDNGQIGISDDGGKVLENKVLVPSSSGVSIQRRNKTASGHDAGLQTGAGFGRTEKEMKARRDEEMKNADPTLQGAGQETVYRDRKGKKLDMLSEFMRQQAVREGKEFKIEKAQNEWGKGTVQKLEGEALRQELVEVASEPFARTVDNPRMEAMRKEIMRDGDPMAEYFARKKEKEDDAKAAANTSLQVGEDFTPIVKKPRYKGPIGAPNRFHIFPGYRWDGIDRGNKYEHKILTKSNDRTALKEDEYRWSVSDM